MKKRTLFVMLGVVITTLGCSLAVNTPGTPTLGANTETAVATMPATQEATAAPTDLALTQEPTQANGTPVSFENVSFVIPAGVAAGANTETMTAVDTNSGAPWDIAPTHLRFTLTGYALEGKLHEPRIFVYPAEEYAQSNPGAAEQIERLKKILTGSPPMQETLPTVPFFNAASQIAAQIKLLPFQNGNGVRALTQYAQYAAPINNHELFYHFQGLTSDGKHYVIAVLPIIAPILAEDEKPEAPVPAEGVPIPTDIGPNEVYYISVTEKLNSLSQDAFSPSLEALDALIQSLLVTDP